MRLHSNATRGGLRRLGRTLPSLRAHGRRHQRLDSQWEPGVRVSRPLQYEPFILAVQAQQVYFTAYPNTRTTTRSELWAVCKVEPRLYPDYEVEEDHGHCNDEFFQLDDIDDFSHGHGGMLELQDDIRLCNDTKIEEVEVNDIIRGRQVYQQEEEEDEEEEFLSKSTTDEDDDENELDLCTSKNEDDVATSECLAFAFASSTTFIFASSCAFRLLTILRLRGRWQMQELHGTKLLPIDRHGEDSTQHPMFDAMAWLAATGQPKKSRVFRFESGLDVGGVTSSSQDSHGSTIVTTSPHSSTLLSDQVHEAPPIRDPTIEACQVERAERDEDEDPRI
ncbi:hypothetical protein Taro_044486 [Colocasia esculenta]|uniref:Uncharacterized protein n=1 Tax=Colocasia esculenta TaxID=4460 RepID=A0A843X5I7_COLES|nr:hypothetical protein [Colocasia esculenta]